MTDLAHHNEVHCDDDEIFCGEVKVYSDYVYIDQRTKEGYADVINLMESMLEKLINTWRVENYTKEELKQELYIILINGISNYKMSLNNVASLSTFLHVHTRNKLISLVVRSHNISRDASFIQKEDNDDDGERHVGGSEVLFSTFRGDDSSYGAGEQEYTDYISNYLCKDSVDFYYFKTADDRSGDRIDFNLSLNKVLRSVDLKLGSALELICYRDYSYKQASEATGIPYQKLKKLLLRLSKRCDFREAFLNS